MLRLVSIGIVLLASIPGVWGQNAGPGAASGPSATCQIEGVAVNAATGLPAHKVTLHLLRRVNARLSRGTALAVGVRARSAVTDVSGRFVFRSLEPGRYALWGQGTGFPRQAYGQRSPYGQGKLLTLSPGEDLKDVEFHLQPEGVITGRVLDEDGDPRARVPVHALLREEASGQTRYRIDGSDRTNDLGEYRLFGLHAGSHFVEAAPNRWASPSAGVGATLYAAEFYPGTLDPSQATPVDIHPGDEISGIDISLTPVKPASIQGQVVNQVTGQPVMGAYVNVQRGGGRIAGISTYVIGANTDGNGKFELDNIAPGSYSISVQYQADGRTMFGALPVNVDGGEELNGVELDIAPGAELSGRVILPSGAHLQPDALTVILRPVNPADRQYGGAARVKTDGTFKLANIAPGAYRVNVVGFPEEYYLKSAKLNGAEVLAAGATIYPGQSAGVLNVALSLDGGRLSGVVMNGQKTVDDATVVLIPDPPLRNRDDLYSTKRTDEHGRFTMLGLPPGDYKLFAWEDLSGQEFKAPDFMRLFESRGQPVHIEARTAQSVELQVIPASALPQ